MDRHLLIVSANYKVLKEKRSSASFPGAVYAEAGFQKPDGETFYICCRELTCIPTFYKTDHSILEELVRAESNILEADPAFLDYLDQCCMREFGKYSVIYAQKDPEWYDLLRYVIYIIDSDYQESDEFIGATVGNYLDEIDTPASEVEGLD